MKKIKAKLEEARQLVDLIQSNAEKAIEKSKILLANTRKTTLSFKETKQSFDNSKNSFERNNVSTNKLIKTINNYIENPTKQNLELVKDKNNIAIDRNNLFSNRVFICTRNFKNTKSNLLENKENILELIKKLKKSKVIFKKLKNTYEEIGQIYESKRIIKALNDSTLNKPRIIFNISNTTPRPNCDEISESIKEKEDRILLFKEGIDYREKEMKPFQDYLDKTQDEFDKLVAEIVEIKKLKNLIEKNNEQINKEVKRLTLVVFVIGGLRNQEAKIKNKIGYNNVKLQIIYSRLNKKIPTKEDNAEINKYNDDNDQLFTQLSVILNNPDYADYGVGQDGLDNLRESIENLDKTITSTEDTHEKIEKVNFTLEPLAKKRSRFSDEVETYKDEISDLEDEISDLEDEISDLKEQLEDCDDPV